MTRCSAAVPPPHFRLPPFSRVLLALLCLVAQLANARGNTDYDVLQLRARLDNNPFLALSANENRIAAARRSPNPKALLEALVLKAIGYSLIGNAGSARPALEEGLALAGKLGDRRSEALLMSVEGEVQATAGNFVEAETHFKAALVLAKAGPDKAALALIEAQYGWALSRFMGRHSEGTPLLDEALRTFEALGDRARLAEAHSMYATLYERLLASDRAHAERERALKLLDRSNHSYLIASLLYEIGTDDTNRGRLTEAEQNISESLALSRQIRDSLSVAFCEVALADVAIKRGHWNEASTLLQRARPLIATGDNATTLAGLDGTLAEALAAQRDPLAWKSLEAIQSFLRSHPDETLQRTELRARAAVNAAFNHYAEAYAAARELEIAERDFYQQTQAEHLVEMDARYQTERAQAENIRLRMAERLAEAELAARHARLSMLAVALALALAVLLAGVLLLIRQTTLKRRYQTLALRDELTGAPNRRAIMASATEALSHAADSPLALAILDLDHFKLINDSFGHEAGDAALRAFYQTAQSHLRAGDKLGRSGGEEWLLVMPDTHAEAITRIFARIRETLQSEPIDGLPADLRIRFSMGATIAQQGETLNETLRRADGALYRAKQGGRDRLELDPGAPPTA